MATRFYLPSSGAADVSPAYSSEWDNTGSASRLQLSRLRSGSAMADAAITDATATANRDVLIRQYVSAPLSAQTISGTVKGYIRAIESSASDNLRAQVVIRVVSNDGSSVVGTLYAGDLTTGTSDPTSEFDSATMRNREYPRGGAQAISSLAVSDGDRLVIEIGWRKHVAASVSGTLRIGDADTSLDLAEDESSSSDYNPWIEFSGNLQGGYTGTRVYFPATGSPPISPTYSSAWDITADADRRIARLSKGATSLASKQATQPLANNNGQDMLLRQYVCENPLQAQTIQGAVLGVFRALESTASADYSPQCLIRVMAPNGTTERGVLYAGHNAAAGNEPLTSLESRYFPRGGQQTFSSVSAQAGDYLVIELGFRIHNGDASAYTGDIEFGDAPTTALDASETDSDADYPWLQFSQAIQFSMPVVISPPAAAATASTPAPKLRLTPSVATGTGAALTPVVRDRVVTPLATASGTAIAPALALKPPAATVSATAPAPALPGVLRPPVSTASGAVLAPTLRSTLPAPAAIANAVAVAPVVRGAVAATVATANGSALTPRITFPVPLAAASGVALAPVLRGGASVPLSQASGAALTPALRGAIASAPATGAAAGVGPRLAFAATVATASALAPEPAVEQTASTVTIVVPLAAVSGAAVAPTLLASIPGPLATAGGAALAPVVRGTVAAVVATAGGAAAAPVVRPALATPTASASSQAVGPALAVNTLAAAATGAAGAPTVAGDLAAPGAAASGAGLAPAPLAAARPPAAAITGAGVAPLLALTPLVATAAGAAIAPLPRATIGLAPATASGHAQTPDIPALGVTIIAPPAATASGSGVAPALSGRLSAPVATSGAGAGAPAPRAAFAAPAADAASTSETPQLVTLFGAPAAHAAGAAHPSVPIAFFQPGIAGADGLARAPGALVDVLVPIATGSGGAASPAIAVVYKAETATAGAAGLDVTLPTLSPPVLIVRAPLRVDQVMEGAVTTDDVLEAHMRFAPVLTAKRVKVEQ